MFSSLSIQLKPGIALVYRMFDVVKVRALNQILATMARYNARLLKPSGPSAGRILMSDPKTRHELGRTTLTTSIDFRVRPSSEDTCKRMLALPFRHISP